MTIKERVVVQRQLKIVINTISTTTQTILNTNTIPIYLRIYNASFLPHPNTVQDIYDLVGLNHPPQFEDV